MKVTDLSLQGTEVFFPAKIGLFVYIWNGLGEKGSYLIELLSLRINSC